MRECIDRRMVNRVMSGVTLLTTHGAHRIRISYWTDGNLSSLFDDLPLISILLRASGENDDVPIRIIIPIGGHMPPWRSLAM